MVGRILGIQARTQLVSFVRPALVGALLLSAAYGLSEVWLAASWLSLIAGIGATVVLVLPLAFYAGITPSLRPRFTGRLQSLLRRGGE
jgi:hypothetical protein